MTAMSFNEAFAKRNGCTPEDFVPTRQLTSIKIDHIAAVDKPANEHALAKIIKRAGDPAEGENHMDPHQAFDAAVESIRKRDNCQPLNAIYKAMAEHPDLYEASAKAPPAPKIEKRADDARSVAIEKSNKSLDDIAKGMQRPGESFAKAYDRMLSERPELYKQHLAATQPAYGYLIEKA